MLDLPNVIRRSNRRIKMFTIKIIEPCGRETVKEVLSLIYRPGKETETGNPCVTYYENRGEILAIDVCEGQVYLMNENGKTVADYGLSFPK
jgi:hypothetical protein